MFGQQSQSRSAAGDVRTAMESQTLLCLVKRVIPSWLSRKRYGATAAAGWTDSLAYLCAEQRLYHIRGCSRTTASASRRMSEDYTSWTVCYGSHGFICAPCKWRVRFLGQHGLTSTAASVPLSVSVHMPAGVVGGCNNRGCGHLRQLNIHEELLVDRPGQPCQHCSSYLLT